MSVGHYSGMGNECRFEDIEAYSLADLLGQEVADIVGGQLEGFGYSYGTYKGHLIRFDMCYADNCTEFFICSPIDLLEDALEWRIELLSEKYDDEYDPTDISVIELYKMNEAYKELTYRDYVA